MHFLTFFRFAREFEKFAFLAFLAGLRSKRGYPLVDLYLTFVLDDENLPR